jgi:hypothetical protein
MNFRSIQLRNRERRDLSGCDSSQIHAPNIATTTTANKMISAPVPSLAGFMAPRFP